MDRQDNPYRPGAGTDPPTLVGRQELLDDFEVTVKRALRGKPGKSCMVTGLRGVGKTVLLNRFCGIASEAGVKTVFLEAPETGDFRTHLAVRLRRVLLEFQAGRIRQAARTAVEVAQRVLVSFTLRLPGSLDLSFDLDPQVGQADSGILSEDLTDLFLALGEAASKCESGIVLAVDEVQYLGQEEFAALIAAIHRTTQLDLPVVLVGAGLPQLPGLAGKAKSYSERLFTFPVINSLSDDQAAEVITIPAQERGVSFDPEAVDIIVDESKGYPYFLQVWGSHVWDIAPASPITYKDVRSARALVLDALDRDFFRVRLDRLTVKEKEYLQAMVAMGSGPYRSGSIAAELGVRVESVAPRRANLIQKGMIYSPAHGENRFTVPLFDDFLRRTQ